MRHRCEICGKFYSDPTPDSWGCDDHWREAKERHERLMAYRERLAKRKAEATS
jgi:hypothetical protein